MTFFFAGQETTSSTMTWVLYLLSQSPEWRDRVAEEAESVRGYAVEALVQTRAVVEEAPRLYPPVSRFRFAASYSRCGDAHEAFRARLGTRSIRLASH
jgi:cytochrome P450